MIELKRKQVITKKFHWCEVCGYMIAKGRFCFYIVSIVDRAFHHGWSHIKCIDTED